jgi:TonB family protein
LLRLAGIQERVLVRVIIDSIGRAESASVEVIESPHSGFDQAARAVLLEARFPHGRSRQRAVRALIEFRLDGRAGV